MLKDEERGKRLGITLRRKSVSGRKRGGICWERSVLLWAGSSLRGASILYSLSRIVTPSQGFLILPPNIQKCFSTSCSSCSTSFLVFLPPNLFFRRWSRAIRQSVPSRPSNLLECRYEIGLPPIPPQENSTHCKYNTKAVCLDFYKLWEFWTEQCEVDG